MLWEIADARETAHRLGRSSFLEEHAGPVLLGLAMRPGSLIEDNSKRFSPTTGQPLRQTMQFEMTDVLGDADDLGVTESLSWVMKLTHHDNTPVAMHIGRLVDSHLTLADYSVSEHHATMTLSSDLASAQLIDHHSTNGTFLNDHRLRAYLAVDVSSGDQLRFGRVQFRFLSAEGLWDLLGAH